MMSHADIEEPSNNMQPLINKESAIRNRFKSASLRNKPKFRKYVVIITVGATCVWLLAQLWSFLEISSANCECGFPVRVEVCEDCHIELFIDPRISPKHYGTFAKAARKVSKVIAPTDWRTHERDESSFNEICAMNGDLFSHQLVLPREWTNKLWVLIGAGLLEDNVATHICALNVIDGKLRFIPSVATTLFSESYLEGVSESGLLEDVVTQELLHALGLGTIWTTNEGKAFHDHNDFVTNAVMDSNNVIHKENIPVYSGQKANEIYQASGGLGQIPLQNIDSEEALTKRGYVDIHWSKDAIANDIMVSELKSGRAYEVTKLSIAALEDLGYSGNYDEAPDLLLSSETSRTPPCKAKHISSTVKVAPEKFDLMRDLAFQKIHVIDMTGSSPRRDYFFDTEQIRAQQGPSAQEIHKQKLASKKAAFPPAYYLFCGLRCVGY